MREALHDIELGYADIQALSDADAVAAFFERLGYNTSVHAPSGDPKKTMLPWL